MRISDEEIILFERSGNISRAKLLDLIADLRDAREHERILEEAVENARFASRQWMKQESEARADLAKAEALIPKQHSTFNGWGIDHDKCPCSTCKEIRSYFDAKREGAQ